LNDGGHELELYQPYNFYEELRWHIKNALSTRRDLDVRIEMGFDAMLYHGGLKSLGYLKKRERGHEVYGIKAYMDLIPLFGENWHIRIKNKQLDFCYASLETIEFYIRKRAPVQEFTLSGEAITSVFFLISPNKASCFVEASHLVEYVQKNGYISRTTECINTGLSPLCF